MIATLINAFASCLPLIIFGIVATAICWKNRGRIENFKIGLNGLEIQFCKSSRLRK